MWRSTHPGVLKTFSYQLVANAVTKLCWCHAEIA